MNVSKSNQVYELLGNITKSTAILKRVLRIRLLHYEDPEHRKCREICNELKRLKRNRLQSLVRKNIITYIITFNITENER